jgi:polyhydroxyalkanoate synthesis regulator phasin
LLTEQLAEAQAKLLKAHELIEARDDDVQTLNEIKSFVNDPTMAEHVKAIDAKLRGIEQEVEKGESTPDEAHAKTRELLEQTRTEMADIQNSTQAEALVQRADIISDKLLAQLPETYTEQDKSVVMALWTEKMDWDRAIKDPDNISEQLTEDFQEALDTYGTPRGALFTVEEVEELKPEATTKVQTPDEKLAELMDKPWGGLKKTDLGDGKTKVEPEMSDDEFSAGMASLIREAAGR